MGRPPGPGEGGRLYPGGDPRAPRFQPPPDQPPQHATQPGTAANAETRRISYQPPTTPTPDRTTPISRPEEERGGGRKGNAFITFLRNYAIWIIIGSLLVLIAVPIGVELYVRNEANNKIAAATACKVQDQATASFGVTPLVTWQYLTDHYTNITIETAGNQIRDAKGMKLNLGIKDVRLNNTADSKGTIGAIDATITWTADGIKQTIQNAVPVVGEFVTRSVTTHPADKTVELKGTLNDIVARPTVSNGGLRLEIMSFNALGFKLPKESVQSSLDEYTSDLTNKLPLGIKAESVDVTDSGVVVTFRSRNATIPAGETDPCFADL